METSHLHDNEQDAHMEPDLTDSSAEQHDLFLQVKEEVTEQTTTDHEEDTELYSPSMKDEEGSETYSDPSIKEEEDTETGSNPSTEQEHPELYAIKQEDDTESYSNSPIKQELLDDSCENIQNLDQASSSDQHDQVSIKEEPEDEYHDDGTKIEAGYLKPEMESSLDAWPGASSTSQTGSAAFTPEDTEMGSLGDLVHQPESSMIQCRRRPGVKKTNVAEAEKKRLSVVADNTARCKAVKSMGRIAYKMYDRDIKNEQFNVSFVIGILRINKSAAKSSLKVIGEGDVFDKLLDSISTAYRYTHVDRYGRKDIFPNGNINNLPNVVPCTPVEEMIVGGSSAVLSEKAKHYTTTQYHTKDINKAEKDTSASVPKAKRKLTSDDKETGNLPIKQSRKKLPYNDFNRSMIQCRPMPGVKKTNIAEAEKKRLSVVADNTARCKAVKSMGRIAYKMYDRDIKNQEFNVSFVIGILRKNKSTAKSSFKVIGEGDVFDKLLHSNSISTEYGYTRVDRHGRKHIFPNENINNLPTVVQCTPSKETDVCGTSPVVSENAKHKKTSQCHTEDMNKAYEDTGSTSIPKEKRKLISDDKEMSCTLPIKQSRKTLPDNNQHSCMQLRGDPRSDMADLYKADDDTCTFVPKAKRELPSDDKGTSALPIKHSKKLPDVRKLFNRLKGSMIKCRPRPGVKKTNVAEAEKKRLSVIADNTARCKAVKSMGRIAYKMYDRDIKNEQFNVSFVIGILRKNKSTAKSSLKVIGEGDVFDKLLDCISTESRSTHVDHYCRKDIFPNENINNLPNVIQCATLKGTDVHGSSAVLSEKAKPYWTTQCHTEGAWKTSDC